MDYLKSCCTTIFSSLPKAELPFIQAVIWGTLCSFILLGMMHQRYYKTTLSKSLLQIFKDMFICVPKPDHSEFMKCDQKTCLRCQRSEELKVTVVGVWNKMVVSDQAQGYPRIEFGINKLKNLPNPSKNDNEKYVQENKATIFSMNLEMRPLAYWTSFDCFSIEKELLDINFNIIKDEFHQIFKFFQNGNTYGWKLNHIPSGHWCIFPIIDQGNINEENCMKCPNTSALLGSLPSLMKDCVFGNACFSLLFPNSYVEPHYGPTNARLRCHLGLQIPDNCWLEVNGTQVKWKEGKCIIFDDSFEHSAYYGSNQLDAEPRVILLLDFWHPNITRKEKDILQKLFKPEYF